MVTITVSAIAAELHAVTCLTCSHRTVGYGLGYSDSIQVARAHMEAQHRDEPAYRIDARSARRKGGE